MIEDRAREDIAFIRETIEAGRTYATSLGSDMVVWGVAVAIGHLTTYLRVGGGLSPGWIWAACIGLPWLYSLRRYWRRFLRNRQPTHPGPMAKAQQMLWLGFGIFLTTLAIAASWTGEMRLGWFDAVAAGALGSTVFATAWLASLPWMRWVAVGWWGGELLVYGLRNEAEMQLVSAALMLLLLALPGLVLVTRRMPRRSA